MKPPTGPSPLSTTLTRSVSGTAFMMDMILSLTWWMPEPYKGVDEGLQSYADFLRQRLGAVTTGLGEGFGGGGGRRPGWRWRWWRRPVRCCACLEAGGARGGAPAEGATAAESAGPAARPAPGGGPNRERNAPIVGNPIGREVLLSDLKFEMISYSPEELIELAETELKWCENEMKKAARDMGHGDDWEQRSSTSKPCMSSPASSRL